LTRPADRGRTCCDALKAHARVLSTQDLLFLSLAIGVMNIPGAKGQFSFEENCP
jgi:hypothetical protein